MKTQINDEFKFALEKLETSLNHIFITGKAGTGKSTLLQHFRQKTKKNIVVLASTGVAALNVGGQTIHSFFKFPPHVTPESIEQESISDKLLDLLEKIDTIVIDEISMVRADLMDCIDTKLRMYLESSLPFGGIQLVLIGDLFQLSPVVTRDERHIFQTQYPSPFFFSSKAFQDLRLLTIELTQIYRQEDKNFIKILNKIRENTIAPQELETINQRLETTPSSKNFSLTLTTTNAAADKINTTELSKLPAKTETFHHDTSGDFPQKNYPTHPNLQLKIGAQIMLLTNDPQGKWANGSIGEIIDIDFDEATEEETLVIKLNNKKKIRVHRHTWEIKKYFWNNELEMLDVDLIGSFTQFPVRLAWAITIHKSQGKTFDQITVDIGNGAFSPGQVYVALSRCRSLEGITLKKPIQRRHIWSDKTVQAFHST